MSLDLFPPRAIVGYVTVGGQKLPVEISPEFYRALRVLVSRVGGASSTDVAQSEIADAFAVGSESVGQLFFDVLQPVESQAITQETIQTPTDNSFANETTYA